MEKVNIFEKYISIYIWGYNNLGRNAYRKLSTAYPEKVKGIVLEKYDNRSRNAVKNEHKPIIELAELSSPENTLVVIAMDVRIYDEDIIKALKNAGVAEYVFYTEDVDAKISSLLVEQPKLQTRLLAISVGQACSLKCKDCANFAPYAKKENMRYSLESIKNGLDKLLPFFEEIDTFHIQGGKPFLYSDLAELICYCKQKYGNILKKIQIATNATLIPNKKVLEALAQTQSIIRISDYPLPTKAKELVEISKRNNIAYRYYHFAGNTSEWSDCGEMGYIVPDDEDVELKVQKCLFNTCLTIENGVVGRCARSIPAISLQNVEIQKGDYLFLDSNLSFEEAAKYFMFLKPMTCCRYCKGTSGEKIKPAIQLARMEN